MTRSSSMPLMRPARRRGFTLLELLTVMVIISVVLSAGIVSYIGARRGMEMRGARSSVQSALSMARQHAVTKRRTTAVVFRQEGTTNCFYIFERSGKVSTPHATILYSVPPPLPASQGYWPSIRTVVCNMSFPEGQGGIGFLNGDPMGYDDFLGGRAGVTWNDVAGVSPDWRKDNIYGFQVGEKMFLPPAIRCTLDNAPNFIVLFYANGKSSGVDVKTITFKEIPSVGTMQKTLTVYPLAGLVKMD